MAKRGKLVVFSGPSGVGKGTISNALKANEALNIKFSTSATTREPRNGEVHGVHYFFISHEEFDEMVKNGEFLEHATFSGNSYGTPYGPINDLLEQGYNVVLEIEIQGGLQVMELGVQDFSIFILPPDLETLEKRIRGRGSETEESIQKRLATAVNELNYQDKYDYKVVNDDLDKAIQEVTDIFMKEINK